MSDLGFTHRFDVAGRLSVADLFPKSKPRCGIYLLEFTDGLSYIGKTKNIVGRFAQHRKNYDTIAFLSFQVVKANELDFVERDLIHRAEFAGVAITNRVHVSQILGETDLDFLIPRDEQVAWLQNAALFDNDDRRVHVAVDEKHCNRHIHQFQRLQQHPQFESIVAILTFYLHHCILAPKRTEYSFWSISCMPSTNASTWPRLAVINLNQMETFVIGHYKEDPSQLWSFLNIAAEHFEDTYTDEAFQEKYPNTIIRDSNYAAAGYDQLNIKFSNLKQLSNAIQDNTILEAASILNLRLMQRGANKYASSHCFDLANLLL